MKLSRQEEERAKELHQNLVVLDAHSDIGIDIVRRRPMGEKEVLERLHVPKLREGGVNASFVTMMSDSGNFGLGTTDHPSTLTFHTVQLALQDIAESKSLMLATSVQEIKEGARAGRIPLVLHFEGAKPFGQNVALVKAFHALGVRSAQLTWNGRNLVADGAGERSGAGLSNFGVDLIREMNRQHFLIDLSHISDRGFWDVLEVTQDPMIVSHANCRALCDHKRNLTDEMIKALSEKGGVIGVCFYPGFIGKEATLEKLLDHVDHIRDLVGVNHIGVGPDFIDYVHTEGEMRSFPGLYGGVSNRYPEGLEDTTKLVTLTKGLVSRGYTDKEIEKIWAGNLLRVYERVWGA